VKKERMNRILALWEQVAETFYRSQKGKILEVLVEKSNMNSKNWSGWTQNYIEGTQDNFEIISWTAKRNEIITWKFI
jgi:tRNA A37 methylthiotransferase MiaB